jgi:hypothetical protein
MKKVLECVHWNVFDDKYMFNDGDSTLVGFPKNLLFSLPCSQKSRPRSSCNQPVYLPHKIGKKSPARNPPKDGPAFGGDLDQCNFQGS